MKTARHFFFLFIALFLPGGIDPARGDVICYERGITVEAKTNCTKVTLTPQPSNQAALDKLRQEHQAELEREKQSLLGTFLELSCDYCQSCQESVTAATTKAQRRCVWEVEAARKTSETICQQQLRKEQQIRGLMEGEARLCSLITTQVGGLVERVEVLQGDLKAAQAVSAPRPGVAELAAFPAGAASPGLALMGGGALLGGFLLGLPARTGWRARLGSGLLAALLALLVFLGGVWLAPDTRPVYLLLVLSVALLLLALRALLRACLGSGLRRRAGLS